MLIEIDSDLPTALAAIQQEIQLAAQDKKHPFRYVVFGTANTSPAMRYVVLRQVDEDFNLIFYTDQRSNKISQLKNEPQAQLLFYDPQKRAQVIITGIVTVHSNNDVTRQHWQNVQGEARKAYCSKKAPGDKIGSPKEAYDWDEDLSSTHFSVLNFEPKKIETLQLSGLEHLRVVFSKADDWKGSWLVP